MGKQGDRVAFFVVIFSLALSALVCADDYRSIDSHDGWGPENVRAVQEKLRDDGLYFGEIDGAYSSELAAALGRYQIRNALPITGQLDVETSNALGVKPAVTNTTSLDQPRTSEAWQRLRKNDQQPTSDMPAQSVPAPTATITSNIEEPALAPPATANNSPTSDFGTERLRDYVGAFVLAGLDPQVGAEAAFFADRVQYYDEGTMDREKIRDDLKRYDSRWPGRKFWLAGEISVEPQSDKRVRVTFPLRYELRNGGRRASGKVKKTLLLEQTGNDFQIVAVNERKLKQ